MSIGFFIFFYLAKNYQLGDGKNWEKTQSADGFLRDCQTPGYFSNLVR